MLFELLLLQNTKFLVSEYSNLNIHPLQKDHQGAGKRARTHIKGKGSGHIRKGTGC